MGQQGKINRIILSLAGVFTLLYMSVFFSCKTCPDDQKRNDVPMPDKALKAFPTNISSMTFKDSLGNDMSFTTNGLQKRPYEIYIESFCDEWLTSAILYDQSEEWTLTYTNETIPIQLVTKAELNYQLDSIGHYVLYIWYYLLFNEEFIASAHFYSDEENETFKNYEQSLDEIVINGETLTNIYTMYHDDPDYTPEGFTEIYFKFGTGVVAFKKDDVYWVLKE